MIILITLVLISLCEDLLIWMISNIDFGMSLYLRNSILVGMYWVVLYLFCCVTVSQISNRKWYLVIFGPFYLLSLLPYEFLVTLIYFVLSLVLYGVSLAFLDENKAFRYPFSISKILLICAFNSLLLHIKYNKFEMHPNNNYIGHSLIFLKSFVERVTRLRLFFYDLENKLNNYNNKRNLEHLL